MSGIGFSELIILFLIGLIVLGPERLPRVANQLGSWLGQARRMTRVMKRQLEEELNLEQELSINPQQTVSKPDFVTPANDTDDTYSPAHDADEAGTGVADEILTGAKDDVPDGGETTAEAAVDSAALDEDIESAIPADDQASDDKTA